MNRLELSVCTPEHMLADVEVDSAVLPGSEGELGILPDHTSLVASLEFGVLRYRIGSTLTDMLCGNGFLEVHDNRVSVLVRSAEAQSDIDVERAKEALERARSRINSMGQDIDLIRAELALHRAIRRIEFSKHHG